MKSYSFYFVYFQLCCLAITLQEIEAKCLPTELSIETTHWHTTKTSCNSSCPVNQYIFQQACLPDCPPFTSKIDNGFIKYCTNPAMYELECLSEFCNSKYPYCFKGNCISSCPEYTVSYNGSCLMYCPKESSFLTASCEGVCYTGAKFCSKTCPISHPYIFSSQKLQHCLIECPTYTAIDGRYCRLFCPVEYPLLFNKTCVEICPDTHPMIILQTSPFNEIFTCTTNCPKDIASYRNVCVFICPSDTFLDNGVHCVEKCGNKRPFINTTPSERKSIYYHQCVSNCPLGKYSLKINATFECVSKCPSNYSLYNNSCALKCPLSHPIKKITTLNKIEITICVKRCTSNMFSLENICVYLCPTPLVHYMSKCLSECPKSFPFILKFNRTCITVCPIGFMKYDHTCVDKCPKQALYIENGTCVEHCVNANSLVLVTDIGNTCIKSEACNDKTVLMKGTKTCILVCPRKTHAIIKEVCTNITECPVTYVLEDTKKGYHCQKKCSDPLFRNGRTCVSQCPANKLITERNCTDTCFGTRPLKYKNDWKGIPKCVSECPDGYYMHKNECLSRDSCYGIGLTYTYNRTCYTQCPPGTEPHSSTHTCTAYDTSQLWYSVASYFVCSGFSFLFFYMSCCFKGFTSTRLKSCLNRILQGFQKKGSRYSVFNNETSNNEIRNENYIEEHTMMGDSNTIRGQN